ncbi:hypothetical protein BG452_05380 [Streptomyces sp. CBMA123]|nr:hypothetical protein [Streptomyces sp. CBMA123]
MEVSIAPVVERRLGALPASAEFLRGLDLGRALDAIAPHVEQIIGTVGGQAIAEFGIDCAQLRWDMTSLSLYGDYEGTGITRRRWRGIRRPGTGTRRTGARISSRSRPGRRSPARVASRCSTAPTAAGRPRSPRWSAR